MFEVFFGILFIIPSLYIAIPIINKNGIPFREYKLNDFVKCKYYKNDFIVLENVTENDIPNDIKNKLESLKINNDDE